MLRLHIIYKTYIFQRYVLLTNEVGEVIETDYCDDVTDDARCLHYNCAYVAVTPKLSHV